MITNRHPIIRFIKKHDYKTAMLRLDKIRKIYQAVQNVRLCQIGGGVIASDAYKEVLELA